MTATIIKFKPKPRADEDAIPPRPIIGKKLWHALLGMTPGQADMAHRLQFRSDERRELTSAALMRYFKALRAFKPALADYREELLKNMDMYCPRAAKRIRESKPPRRRKAKV